MKIHMTDYLTSPDFHVSLSPCRPLSFKPVKMNQVCSRGVMCVYFFKRRFIRKLKACKMNVFEKHCEVRKTQWHDVHAQCVLLVLHWFHWHLSHARCSYSTSIADLSEVIECIQKGITEFSFAEFLKENWQINGCTYRLTPTSFCTYIKTDAH